MPGHFVNMLVRLHAGAVINVKIGEGDTAVGSSTGVRQSTCEGPILFLFIMQAALEAMEWPVTKPTFRARADGVTSGERFNRKRGVAPFGLPATLTADDNEIYFETGEGMVTEKSSLSNHLRRWWQWRQEVCLATFLQLKSLGTHCQRLVHVGTHAREETRTRTGCE